MADWDDAVWPAADSAPTRADRRGGPYSTYRPDLLVERPLTLAADVSELAGRVEASVRRLGELPGSRGLEDSRASCCARRPSPPPASRVSRSLRSR